MHISRIVIRNFRNFSLLDCALGPGVTCIIGENNTGKTNLLHALRLVIDVGLSSTYRALTELDLHALEDFSVPNQVAIALELVDYQGKTSEEALVSAWEIAENRARIMYRFRPRREIREAIAEEEHPGTGLTLENYHWEISVSDGTKDPASIAWNEDCGTSVRFADLQAFQVVLLPAIRDVQADLRQSRVSPLGRLLEASDIPEEEKQSLTEILSEANQSISDTPTIKDAGTAIDEAFKATAGDAYNIDVRLGMTDPSFASIARSLTVLLSTEAVKDFDPSRNGLGLNNVLYISMLLEYFERRAAKLTSAGQLLLIEEPEAHLHPQLQRVLYAALSGKPVQTILTTHSTHISSLAPLSSYMALTNDGSAASCGSALAAETGATKEDIADLERYLDATRSTLLYARRVIMVEGPAELFLIPPLVKKVKNIDLDRLGISVIPIHGTHFGVYAKLFSKSGMPKKCAIITDGDLTPSDADASIETDDELTEPPDLSDIEGDFVKVFQCRTTFERELTRRGLLALLRDAAKDVGAVRLQERLNQAIKAKSLDDAIAEQKLLAELGGRVLATAKRVGKARFAQVAARHVKQATALPQYIEEAIKWIIKP